MFVTDISIRFNLLYGKYSRPNQIDFDFINFELNWN